jgi:hypothetical protein
MNRDTGSTGDPAAATNKTGSSVGDSSIARVWTRLIDGL